MPGVQDTLKGVYLRASAHSNTGLFHVLKACDLSNEFVDLSLGLPGRRKGRRSKPWLIAVS